ncbi:MAG: hypothetical protein AAFV53_39340 [Myxococcota bacterium]
MKFTITMTAPTEGVPATVEVSTEEGLPPFGPVSIQVDDSDDSAQVSATLDGVIDKARRGRSAMKGTEEQPDTTQAVSPFTLGDLQKALHGTRTEEEQDLHDRLKALCLMALHEEVEHSIMSPPIHPDPVVARYLGATPLGIPHDLLQRAINACLSSRDTPSVLQRLERLASTYRRLMEIKAERAVEVLERSRSLQSGRAKLT